MRRLYTLLLFSFLFTVAANAQFNSSTPWASASVNKEAQTLSMPKPPPAPSSPTPTNVPIDGGLSVLLAAGVLYGGRAYRTHKKNSVSRL